MKTGDLHHFRRWDGRAHAWGNSSRTGNLHRPALFGVVPGPAGHHVAVGYNFELSVDANRLATAIQLANRQVWKQAEKAPEYSGMGTTIAAVIVNGSKLTVGNVGDSRVYLWHRGSLRQLPSTIPGSTPFRDAMDLRLTCRAIY